SSRRWRWRPRPRPAWATAAPALSRPSARPSITWEAAARAPPARSAPPFRVTRPPRVTLSAMTSPLPRCRRPSAPASSIGQYPGEQALTGTTGTSSLNHSATFSTVSRQLRSMAPPGWVGPLTPWSPRRRALLAIPLAALREYRPHRPEPADLDAFWAETLGRAREASPPVLGLQEVDNGLSLIDTWDVTFAGHDGSEVRAWYNRPAGVEAQLPVVVEYLGYGGGRGEPLERPTW